jgi:hypothetical protein
MNWLFKLARETKMSDISAFVIPELGDRVKDPVTGFTGIVVVVATWLHGCIRVGVQPEGMHEGKPLPEHHFDQSQLVVLEKRAHAPMMMAVVEAPRGEQRRSNGGPARESSGFRRV